MFSLSQSVKDLSFVNKFLLPGSGQKYAPTEKLMGFKLLWLTSKLLGLIFPNLWIPKPQSSRVILYSHGNGGTLKDWTSLLRYYSNEFNTSVLGVEFPGYGCAQGTPSETSVNDSVFSAYDFLLSVGYHHTDIIIIGYSIGTGPSIKLAAELCDQGHPPCGLVTIAAFTSVCEIVQDLKGGKGMAVLSNIGPMIMMDRWESIHAIQRVTCPAYFFHGLEDKLISCEHSIRLHEACKSEFKNIRICEKADHCRFKEPQDTVVHMAMFFEKVCFKASTKLSNSAGIDDVVVGKAREIDASFFVVPEPIIIEAERERLLRIKEEKEREEGSGGGWWGAISSGAKELGSSFYTTVMEGVNTINGVQSSGPESTNNSNSSTSSTSSNSGNSGNSGNSVSVNSKYRENNDEDSRLRLGLL